MSLDDLEFMVQKMSAGSVSVGDWETLIHFCTGKDMVVELGTNIGSTSILLSYCSKQVYTVDVFEDLHLIEDVEFRGKYRDHFASNQHYFSVVSERLLCRTNISACKSLSYKFANGFNDGTVDAIFIDADHSYVGVKRDYDAWFDKVKSGGYYIFHDNTPAFPCHKFIENEVSVDDRVERVEFIPMGKYSTAVFRRVK